MKKEIGRLNTKPGNWIISRWCDIGWFLLPVWLVWLVFLSDIDYFQNTHLPLWAWVVFILGIDVSHVWSSLFRTYLDKEEFSAQKKVLIISPIIALATSLVLLSFSIGIFWRVMAYLAVFHFIKQQYGFIALYKIKAREGAKRTTLFGLSSMRIDKWMVYIATIYPVIYWHFNSSSAFNWFVSNDFFQMHALINHPELIANVFTILNVVYWLLIGGWVVMELRARQNGEIVSTGKIWWMLTTAVNWWFGIVFFNSDLVFSISNVVAHGIPYLGLIYFYRVRKDEIKATAIMPWLKRFKWFFILIFTVLLFAFVEEYFWDMLVYRDHADFFEFVYPYNWEQVSSSWAVIIAIALLALPQQVHYIIDGFIWKMNAKNKYVKPIFKPDHES